MKKVISLFLSILMLMSITAGIDFSALAETSGYFEYQILEDDTAEITRYTGSATELATPSTLDGYTVSSIGEYAFYGCDSLTSVSISNGVTSIGSYAFCECYSLTSVSISNSVTSIGIYAFSYCSSLTSIDVDSGNEFYSSLNGVLFNNDKTELVQYPVGNTKTSYSIPDSVISIGENAFAFSANLTSVTIPYSVAIIEQGAFNYCESLTSIDVDSDNKFYSSLNGVLFNNDKTELVQYPVGNTKTSYSIPNSVTSIGDYAFYECIGLTSLTIPNSVTSIGNAAFEYCSGLTSVTIPNSVTSIGEYAFYGCCSLTSVSISNSLTGISYYAFSHCGSLTSVTIPNSVTSIGDYAFYECIGLTSLTIPNSVISIGDSAFSWCISLKEITIPESVKSIYFSFNNCLNLKNITVLNKELPLHISGLGIEIVWNEDSSQDVPMQGVTINGYSGSTAQSYASAMGFTFVSLDNPTPVIPVTPVTPVQPVAPATNTPVATQSATVKKPKATSIKKLVKGKKSFKVTWKKVSGVSGYQVQYSTSKKFTKKTTKSKTYKGNKSFTKTISKLKSKKTYYVRVRAYKTVNGKKVYSNWSKVKSVKTK